jgi:hypothetical protein
MIKVRKRRISFEDVSAGSDFWGTFIINLKLFES